MTRRQLRKVSERLDVSAIGRDMSAYRGLVKAGDTPTVPAPISGPGVFRDGASRVVETRAWGDLPLTIMVPVRYDTGWGAYKLDLVLRYPIPVYR